MFLRPLRLLSIIQVHEGRKTIVVLGKSRKPNNVFVIFKALKFSDAPQKFSIFDSFLSRKKKRKGHVDANASTIDR